MPNLTGFRCLSLGDAPDLRIIQRPVLDFAHDVGPPPAGIDFVEERARRIVEPGRSSFLGLKVVAFEAGPPLERIVVPCPARQILIDMQIAMSEDVEPSPFLVADNHGHGVLELLAEANVEHASIERPAPHADIEPARAGERSSGRAWQN